MMALGWPVVFAWILGLFWLLVMAAVIVGLVRWLGWGRPWGGSGHAGSWHRDSAEAILRERLARGEIDEEEYQKTLDVLRR